MNAAPLSIAFLSTEDPASPDHFSGITFQLVAALRRQGADVRTLGPAGDPPTRWQRWKRTLYRQIGRNYDPQQTADGFRRLGRQLDTRLLGSRADCVLGRATTPIAALRTRLPVFLWHDATFRQLLSAYRGFVGMPRESRESCEHFEQAAVRRCRGLFYTSQWAAASAREFYGATADRTQVIPIGANRTSGWDEPDAARRIAEKTFSVCRLLFLGVDWHRKGGDRFLRLVARLGELGLPVEATIVGDWPPAWLPVPENVRCLGLLAHSDAGAAARLDRLFSTAHFLVLPSRADCSPVVVAEASSYALPVVCTPVGGLPEMVHDDATGLVGNFDRDDDLDRTATRLAAAFRAPERWRSLARGSRARHRAVFNWDTHAQSLLAGMRTLLARPA